jgi:aminobenzoyl-glutamate transport protein
MSKKDIVQKKPLFQRFLDSVERTGNKLPHPATLFAIFALATVVFSHLAYLLNTSVTVPNLDPDSAADDLVIAAKSLLTREGVRHIFMSTVGSFVGFAPLGIVLVAMLGVGVAEHVGLLTALIKKMILGKSKSMITIMIIFVGLFSNVASEVGYLVVIPLGAAIFYAVGRHPLAGLAAAFFGVSGGFAANVVLSVNDLLLTGITQEAAQLYKPGITVLPTCNYYFMVASTILLVTVGYFVTEKIIVPKLGEYKPEKEVAGGDVSANLTDIERRGLRYAGLALLAAIALLVLLIAPEWAPLRGAETNDILGRDSPIMRGGLVTIIMLVFVVPALAYGIGVKTIKSDKDVITAMSKTMQTMGGYLVLAAEKE